jgi:hypothetical protein
LFPPARSTGSLASLASSSVLNFNLKKEGQTAIQELKPRRLSTGAYRRCAWELLQLALFNAQFKAVGAFRANGAVLVDCLFRRVDVSGTRCLIMANSEQGVCDIGQ